MHKGFNFESLVIKLKTFSRTTNVTTENSKKGTNWLYYKGVGVKDSQTDHKCQSRNLSVH